MYVDTSGSEAYSKIYGASSRVILRSNRRSVSSTGRLANSSSGFTRRFPSYTGIIAQERPLLIRQQRRLRPMSPDLLVRGFQSHTSCNVVEMQDCASSPDAGVTMDEDRALTFAHQRDEAQDDMSLLERRW